MADIRIKDISRTATLRRGEIIETDHATSGSGKIDLADFIDRYNSTAPASFLQSDGGTSARRIETIYGALGAAAGSDLTESDYIFDVPTSNPAVAAWLFAWSSATNPGTNPGWRLDAVINTSGGLAIAQLGATSADFRAFTYAGFRAAYSGKRIRVTVAFTGNSTTAPVVYFDGLDVSSLFTATTGGTPPNWNPTSLDSTYHFRGYTWPAGYFRPGRPINRKFVQADVDFVQVTGRTPMGDNMGGTMVANSTDWESGTGIWNFFTDTTRVNDGTAHGGTYLARINYTAGGFSFMYASSGIAIKPGYRYRIRLWARCATAGTCNFSVGYTNNGNLGGIREVGSGNSFVHGIAITHTTWKQYETTDFLSVDSRLDIWNNNVPSTPTAALDVDDIQIVQLGAFSEPIIQPCLVLDDATSNNKTSILVGFAPVTSTKDFRIVGPMNMSTTGNKQLLGAALFQDAAIALDSIEVELAGTPTFNVNDSVAAVYSASAAYTAGRKRATLAANPFPGATGRTSIYIDIGTAHASDTAVPVTIRGHRT